MQKTNNRPLLLVTNDDGYKAKGLLVLSEIAREFGDVVTVASTESQSGKSHSITIKEPIRYRLLDNADGYKRYQVRGTPVDGVKLVLNKLIGRKPDIILSGINHGSNSSSSIVYSGTMGAAIEGAIHEIPSAGFSILDYGPDADFDACKPYLRELVRFMVEGGLPKKTCLNVNIPAVPPGQLNGIKICRQADGVWIEEFETREDPRGSTYSWLDGSFLNREPEAEDTDEWALAHNYISVVPIKTDFTAFEAINGLKKWENLSFEHEKNN